MPFAARSTVATLSARVGRLMPVSADLGPLAAVLEKAGRPDPADRSTAAELGRSLVRAAETLPRPKPIPILVMAPFVDDPNRMRRPNDPTGGIARPDDAPAPAVLAAPTVATTPEERAADASLVAAGVARPEAATRCRRPPNRRPPPCCTTATPTAPRTSSPSWAARSPRSRRHLPWRRPHRRRSRHRRRDGAGVGCRG